MPTLKNARWELFAQGLAQGKTAGESYVFAGYRENPGNAGRLKQNEGILRRVAEILAPAAKRIEVSVERMAERLGNVAIARVTDFVRIGKKNKLILTSTKNLPPEIADAIASLKPTKDGIEVKFLDPLMAINLLGKHRGMFKENINLSVTLSLADLVNASMPKPEDKA